MPIPKPVTPPKPLIKQSVLDVMKGNDEAAAAVGEDVTMEGDDEGTQKEKAKLKAFIKQAEDWQMDATAAVNKLKELEAKQPVKLQIAASVAAKDLLAEKPGSSRSTK